MFLKLVVVWVSRVIFSDNVNDMMVRIWQMEYNPKNGSDTFSNINKSRAY